LVQEFFFSARGISLLKCGHNVSFMKYVFVYVNVVKVRVLVHVVLKKGQFLLCCLLLLQDVDSNDIPMEEDNRGE
jgi:hypothetical protein